jgi:hypothetical protein
MSPRGALINRKGVEDLSVTMIFLAVHNWSLRYLSGLSAGSGRPSQARGSEPNL